MPPMTVQADGVLAPRLVKRSPEVTSEVHGYLTRAEGLPAPQDTPSARS